MTETGLVLPQPDELDRSTCVDVARIADDRVDAIWVGESWNHNSIVMMTQIAEATESVDVCSGIFNVYSRSPGIVALSAASLSEVADGRFRLGLGVSGPAVIENFHGAAFERPLRRTREYIEIVRSYLAGERVDYDGDLFDIGGFAIPDPPETVPPIYLAAMGEKNLELTGAFADGWLPLLVPKGGFADGIEHIERGAEKAGRSADGFHVAPYIPTCISESDPEAARQHAGSLIGFYVGAMGDYYANAMSRYGYPDEADAIQAGWAESGPKGAAAAVTDEILDAFAACGTPEEAARSFDEFRDAGVTMPVAYPPAKVAPAEMVEETVRHL